MTDGRRRAQHLVLAAACLAATLSGCALGPDLSPVAIQGQVDLTVPEPTPFTGRTFDADLLVTSAAPLPERVVDRVADQESVRRAAPLSVFTIAAAGRSVTVVAGDPTHLRAFSAPHVARRDDAWRGLAAGAAIVSDTAVPDSDISTVQLDPTGALPLAGVAAVTTLPVRTDLMVNESWARALRAPVGNAMLVSIVDGEDVATVLPAIERAVGATAQVVDLTGAGPGAAPRPALLTGGAVAEAVGSFTYVPQPDGTIQIDPDWVADRIVTTDVPILGRVTCHRVMVPQLAGAMAELVERGLADLIDVSQFGGCWVPRFIASDPTRGISLHSWGIAVDLNVSTNHRGTVGDMDPRIVEVMAAWGFAWGGLWSDPDPMHFELAALRN